MLIGKARNPGSKKEQWDMDKLVSKAFVSPCLVVTVLTYVVPLILVFM